MLIYKLSILMLSIKSINRLVINKFINRMYYIGLSQFLHCFMISYKTFSRYHIIKESIIVEFVFCVSCNLV